MYSFLFLRRAGFAVAGALAVACAAIWGAVYVYAPVASAHSGTLTFVVLDVGQGDALYIESPTGVQVLVDAGPNDGSVARELAAVMPFGDRTLDAIIETHPDADHMGGFVDVLARYRAGVFISPGIGKHNTLTDALDAALSGAAVPRMVARRGMSLELGDGARLEVLYPDIDVTGFGERTNEGAIVAHLVYGETSVLLTADAPFSTEDRLLRIASSSELVSDVLKVGHHGSKYSTSDAFIAVVRPEVAVVSVGARNRYGHPTAEALGRLQDAGVRVLRTDESGAVTCRSDGATIACDGSAAR